MTTANVTVKITYPGADNTNDIESQLYDVHNINPQHIADINSPIATKSRPKSTPAPDTDVDTPLTLAVLCSFIFVGFGILCYAIIVIASLLFIMWGPYAIWACNKNPLVSAIVNTIILSCVYKSLTDIQRNLVKDINTAIISEELIIILIILEYMIGLGLMIPSTIFGWMYYADAHEYINTLNGQLTLAYACCSTVFVFITLIIYMLCSKK